jgi:2-methylisocitrate lyase-like PEP mutase family enzyme
MSTLADAFFALHRRGSPFIIPNAWDPASALVYERAGFGAVATSSAASAWTLGYADGERVDTDELFASFARIVRVSRVPVSADIEAGFGISIEAAVRSTERALEAGVVGINLEDYDPQTNDVIPLEAHAARIAAVKARATALGVKLFVNARTDVLLHELGPEESRLDRTIDRLRAYVAAGADGVFAPGTDEAAEIERIATAVDAPLNVLAGPDTPSLADLARLGVARVSIGSMGMRRTLGALADAAKELHDSGTFGFMRERTLTYGELNAMFAERETS